MISNNRKTLLERIQRGEFELSNYLKQSNKLKISTQEEFKMIMNTPTIHNLKARENESYKRLRKNRLRILKLEELGHIAELKILNKFRMMLEKEFGHDLWDDAIQSKDNLKTTEDIFWWYKQKLGFHTTPSEINLKFKE